MTTLAIYVCQCAAPTMYAKPSGRVICQRCGLPIVAKVAPEPRP